MIAFQQRTSRRWRSYTRRGRRRRVWRQPPGGRAADAAAATAEVEVEVEAEAEAEAEAAAEERRRLLRI